MQKFLECTDYLKLQTTMCAQANQSVKGGHKASSGTSAI